MSQLEGSQTVGVPAYSLLIHRGLGLCVVFRPSTDRLMPTLTRQGHLLDQSVGSNVSFIQKLPHRHT